MKKLTAYSQWFSKHVQDLMWLKEFRGHQGTGNRTVQEVLVCECVDHKEQEHLSHELECQRSNFISSSRLEKSKASELLQAQERAIYQHERMLYAYQKD